MPQSRTNSAPCLYYPESGEGDLSESVESLTFDIFTTVTTLRKLMVLLAPLGISCRLVKYVLRWKICSLLCFVLLNILFLTLSQEAWLFLGLFFVLALATLGYWKQDSWWTVTERAIQRQRPSKGRVKDRQTFPSSQQELILYGKALLQELEEMLSQACLAAESAHSLLCWGSCRDSALFYSGLLAVLYLLYTAPGSYTLVVANSALFLWKGELYGVVRNIIWRGSKGTGGHFENREKIAFCGSLGVENEEPDDLHTEYDFKDAIEDGDDDDDDDGGDMPLMGRRGALVGVIPNFQHKGQKQARRRRLRSSSNSGNCSRCQTSFSMLKKKKNCSNCGSSFCARCCCKVQKSCLDTAAPEDQNVIVFVCTLCSVSLNKQ